MALDTITGLSSGQLSALFTISSALRCNKSAISIASAAGTFLALSKDNETHSLGDKCRVFKLPNNQNHQRVRIGRLFWVAGLAAGVAAGIAAAMGIVSPI